jgi:MGT family glycosyltransferase
VPILDELRRRGHEVALRTLASEVGTMRARGFEAAPIAPAIEALRMEDWRARTPPGALLRIARTLGARAAHDAADLQGAIEVERPDALIVDTLAWGALSAAEAWGGPWASTCPFPLPSRRGVERPFVGIGFRRLIGRLNEVRRGLGLRPFRQPEEIFLAAPLVLYMTAEPLEHPRVDWPESVVMVGPCCWEPPGALPPELAGVEEPLILVTTSTEFQDDGRLVRTALEALAGEPYHVVATLPSASADGLRVPANATVLPFAPHEPILARCACAITHGGMGVTQKALSLGVPVCAVPFGRDQPEVARRVEVAGAGARLPARRLSPERLRAKVREQSPAATGRSAWRRPSVSAAVPPQQRTRSSNACSAGGRPATDERQHRAVSRRGRGSGRPAAHRAVPRALRGRVCPAGDRRAA